MAERRTLEADMQTALFHWKRLYADETLPRVEKGYESLAVMFHPANGAFLGASMSRKHYGQKLVAQGMAKGVPDVLVPVPGFGYSMLAIELKVKPNRVSTWQRWWLDALTSVGACTGVIFDDWTVAAHVIARYLVLPEACTWSFPEWTSHVPLEWQHKLPGNRTPAKIIP